MCNSESFFIFITRKIVLLLSIQFLNISFTFNRKHCVKSVQIRSYFWSMFSLMWSEYGEILRIHFVSLRIHAKCGKIRTRNNSAFGHFSPSERIKSSYLLLRTLQSALHVWQLINIAGFTKVQGFERRD